jgi:hypothetical protein
MRKRVLASAVAIGLLASVSAMAANPNKSTAQPGTTIVDANGTLIGNIYGESVRGDPIYRQINGTWYAIFPAPRREGLNAYPASSLDYIYYTSSNCTGVAYLGAFQFPPIAYLTTNAGGNGVTTASITYPATPWQTLEISSVLYGASNTCTALTPGPIAVGVVATQTLTVVPPLSLQ